MKYISLLLLLVSSYGLFAQDNEREVVCVAFYNVENLFDTESSMDVLNVEKYKSNQPDYITTGPLDEERVSGENKISLRKIDIANYKEGEELAWDVRDDENTAEGLRQYTDELYQDKLNQLAKVFADMGTEYTPDGPAIIGIGEIENAQVLEDLAKNEQIADRDYQVIQYNSMYQRGIDVAFMYQAKYFTPTATEVIRLENQYYDRKETNKVLTRDILVVTGNLLGEEIIVFVNHWPSRRAPSKKREMAAASMKVKLDEVLAANPNAKVFVMGDLNDDPISKSVKKVLGAKKRMDQVEEGGLYNPLWKDYKQGYGSLSYRGSWNLFDQIIISSGLLNDAVSWTYHDAEIMYEPYMINHSGGYIGGPNRSFGGNHYQPSGFSDHLPSLLYLTRPPRKDSDKDGIADEEDDCPEIAGIEAFNGCPDSDEDGVMDSEDDCPDVAGLVALAGCPDTDGDGVIDAEDDCPEEKGLVDNNGCPQNDKDKDGVIDEEDKCPETPGLATNDGCPEIKDEVKEVLQLAFENLEFQTGKSIIKLSSDKELNDLARILRENPTIQLKISGHTDNVGNDEANMKLSEDRAKAVFTRLNGLGVQKSRLSTFWYGETQPIDSNDTFEGRQRNRRVTFEVFYK